MMNPRAKRVSQTLVQGLDGEAGHLPNRSFQHWFLLIDEGVKHFVQKRWVRVPIAGNLKRQKSTVVTTTHVRVIGVGDDVAGNGATRCGPNKAGYLIGDDREIEPAIGNLG